MANVDVFKDASIDKDEHKKALQDVVQASKENPMTEGVVSLEKFYDLHNRFQGPVNMNTHSSTLSHEQINLGTENDLKFVNLSTCCMPQERQAFIRIFN